LLINVMSELIQIKPDILDYNRIYPANI